jgi:hypothetical protein
MGRCKVHFPLQTNTTTLQKQYWHQPQAQYTTEPHSVPATWPACTLCLCKPGGACTKSHSAQVSFTVCKKSWASQTSCTCTSCTSYQPRDELMRLLTVLATTQNAAAGRFVPRPHLFLHPGSRLLIDPKFTGMANCQPHTLPIVGQSTGHIKHETLGGHTHPIHCTCANANCFVSWDSDQRSQPVPGN